MSAFLGMVRRVVLAVACLLPVSCAPQTAVISNFSQQSSGITVRDARTAPEQTEWLGSLSTSCGTGIRRLGDDVTNPSRLLILQRDLRAAFGERFAGSTLAITKYTIFFNMSQWVQDSNLGAGKLLDGILIARGCTKNDVAGGWYSSDEVSNANAPIVIEIEANLETATYTARNVYSPPVGLSAAFGKEAESAALFEAIHQAHVKLIQEMRSR